MSTGVFQSVISRESGNLKEESKITFGQAVLIQLSIAIGIGYTDVLSRNESPNYFIVFFQFLNLYLASQSFSRVTVSSSSCSYAYNSA